MQSTKAQELLALAILAYKEGQYDGAAKFFTNAMESEDLQSFVDTILRPVPEAALLNTVPDSENTLNPSIASSSDLASIVETLEFELRASASLTDLGDEEIETRASDEEEEFDSESSNDEVELETFEDDEETSESSDKEVSESSNTDFNLKHKAGPIRFG